MSAAFFCEIKYLRAMQKQHCLLLMQEAQKKMEHYCAYQERCHQEVDSKAHGR